MAVEAQLELNNVPESLRDLAEKWSVAVSASLDLLQTDGTTSEDAGVIIDISLHSAAAIIAPGELTGMEFIAIVNRFSQALADVSAAFVEQKHDHEATRP